ncbi:MAG TPA: M1 family aminopeptidase [Kofleriaceae bacterium]|nr:M1 family aminopeptidase [Kofleriaceae bacterium]
MLLLCAALAACGRPEVAAGARPPAPAAAPAGGAEAGRAAAGTAAGAPGARLPDGVAPLAYDLTLELDPDRASFTGRVAITIAVAAPTAQLWLHAVDLEISRAVLRADGRDAPVVPAPTGNQLVGFALPGAVGPGTVALVIDYTGRVTDLSHPAGKDEQGMFRERTGGRWYLYSQAESVFARRIAPCFDEPRFKPAWRVTAIVPRDQIALGNAPVAAERVLPGGRREVRFAEIAALPSYLLAVAVGPFERVDAGRLGRGRIPVRFAVAAGDGRQVAAAARALPRIIDALERYVGAPLPLAKLDLVAVPEFFGAMENPGLVTFQAAILTGRGDFIPVAAHELAHQWFGDSVTAAWWDHLWLSEAFASWLGERVTAELNAARPAVIAHLDRFRALEADDAIDARPLLRTITTADEVEPAFDAIAYDKGAAVLAMFERFVGADAFQAAVRRYLTGHAGTAVTTEAFLAALGAATRPEVADALGANVRHAGTPVVELALRCDATAPGAAAASVVASAQGGVTVPVCLRFPVADGGTARACLLAGARTEQPLPAAAGCPAWVVGNDGGAGYYLTVWRGAPPLAPPSELSPDERLARGDDAALAVRRGELPVARALAEIAALAGAHDPYAALAALEIARAVDAFADDAVRPAWAAWLAGRFAELLTQRALVRARSVAEYFAIGAAVEIARGAIEPSVAAAARSELERRPGADRRRRLIQLTAVRDAGGRFDDLLRDATAAQTDAARDAALDDLGAFPAALAPRVVGALLDRRLPADRVWPALAEMLARSEARSAAWRAIRDRFPAVIQALGRAGARDALAALAVLCDAPARAELAAAAAPRLAAIDDGRRVLDRTLATIDRCVARRAAAGDLAAALAAPGL